MIVEWIKVVGPILISWPVVAFIAILVFRKPVFALIDDKVTRIKFGNIELEKKVEQVENRQARQASEIAAIEIALKGVLTKHEKGHLEGLMRPGEYRIPYEPDLYRYLHRLDGLNFIQPNPGYGLMSIEERHRSDSEKPPSERPWFDLKEFIHITGDGKIYLNTWKSIFPEEKGKEVT